MRKILVISTIFVLLISMAMVTALPLKTKYAKMIDPDGSFSGYLGFPRQSDPIILGNISGVYKLRNRGGAFNASWDIEYKNHSGFGTLRGFFGRHFLLARLTVEGFNRTLPVIGFIRFNSENQSFVGRAMSIFGPALYFWGNYQPY